MKKQKTRKELEEKITMLICVGVLIVFLCVVGFTGLIYFGVRGDKLETQLSDCQEQVPEVINGNLYIGYEDGVRIGYHNDYINKSIWYRCARSCEVIE